MKQQLKGEILISTVLHITTSEKLILNLTRNARNEIVTKQNMNKTNTNHLTDLAMILLVLVFKDPHNA